MDANQLFNIAERVAVVTGATGGLGRRMASGLTEAGASVAVVSRSDERARELAQALEQRGGRVLACRADVVERSSVERLARRVVEHWGQIDILINAAGGNQPDATASGDHPFFDLPAEALQTVMNLNWLGTLLACQAIGRVMADQRQGVILNLSSLAADRPLTRVVGYGAAKAGVAHFTRWLAVYMAREVSPAIRVNALAPGFFETEQNRFLLRDAATGGLSERGRRILAQTPMGRFGQPDELIGAMRWLVSDAARFVTGVTVPIDGGFSADPGV